MVKVSGDKEVEYSIVLESRADDIADPEDGEMYFNSTLKKIRYYNGSEWLTL